MPSMSKKSEIESSRVPVRLQKLLAEAGIGSRRACEVLIKDGRIKVNGLLVTELGTKAIPELDHVTVDGQPIKLPQKAIYLFNKPRKVISSMHDPEGRKCIGDFLGDLSHRVFPVGRLDYDVSGLMVLTNDGEFANRLLHPSFGSKRVYVARVLGNLDEKKMEALLKGVYLPDGVAKLSDVQILIPPSKAYKSAIKLVGQEKTDESIIRVEAQEGRNHFIKRILEAVGHPVSKLSRIQFGPFRLESIEPGSLRQISLKEELLG